MDITEKMPNFDWITREWDQLVDQSGVAKIDLTEFLRQSGNLETLPSSATAMKFRRCFSSMTQPMYKLDMAYILIQYWASIYSNAILHTKYQGSRVQAHSAYGVASCVIRESEDRAPIERARPVSLMQAKKRRYGEDCFWCRTGTSTVGLSALSSRQ
jgi:hypothetical protein